MTTNYYPMPFYFLYFPDVEPGNEDATPTRSLPSSLWNRVEGRSMVRVDQNSLDSAKNSITERLYCSKLVNESNSVCVVPVTGMTCNSCVKLIETSLPQQCVGVNGLCVSLKRNEAFVEFNTAVTSSQEISTAIYDMGFDTGESVMFRVPHSAPSPSPRPTSPSVPSVAIATPSSSFSQSPIPANDCSSVVVHVTGMVCQSCVQNIETNVGDKPGILNVKVNLDSETAAVSFDPAVTSINGICMMIDDLGFVAVPADGNKLTKQEDDSDVKSYRVGIEGMTCQSCVSLIEDVVSKREGVVSMVVSLKEKEGTIEFLPNIVSIDQLRRDIEDTGFDVTFFTEGKGGDYCRRERASTSPPPSFLKSLTETLDISVSIKGKRKVNYMSNVKVQGTCRIHVPGTCTCIIMVYKGVLDISLHVNMYVCMYM